MSKRGYSNEFQLTVLPAGSCCLDGLVSEVHYADGTVRRIGYADDGLPNCFVETDGTIWQREDGNRWSSNTGESFFGTIEVSRSGSKDGVAGSISIRVTEDGFVVSERILFPIGVAVESRFTRDRQETEREVRLLNGKQLKVRREGRGGLWMNQNGGVAHQPDNPFHFGMPWRHPAALAALSLV